MIPRLLGGHLRNDDLSVVADGFAAEVVDVLLSRKLWLLVPRFLEGDAQSLLELKLGDLRGKTPRLFQLSLTLYADLFVHQKAARIGRFVHVVLGVVAEGLLLADLMDNRSFLRLARILVWRLAARRYLLNLEAMGSKCGVVVDFDTARLLVLVVARGFESLLRL